MKMKERRERERKKTPFAVAEYQKIFLLLYFLNWKTIGTAINLDSLSRAVTGVFPPSCSLIVDRGDIYFVGAFKKFIDFRKIARMTSPDRMSFCFSRGT
jgi:hypothetical protein